jgi:hypothetical protein
MRFLLLVLVLLAVVAIGAALPPLAAGQMELVEEVVEEDTEEPCPPVGMSGHGVYEGCRVHFEGDGTTVFAAHSLLGEFNIECETEFGFYTNDEGEGFVDEFTFTDGDAPCGTTLTTCSEPTYGYDPWAALLVENPFTGDLFIQIEVCFYDTYLEVIEGEVYLLLMESEDNHYVAMTMPDWPILGYGPPPGSGFDSVEVDGEWSVVDATGGWNEIIIDH